MRHLDPARTNRSPFRAPKTPRLGFTTELDAACATTPVVAKTKDGSLRLVVTTLAGSVVFLDFSGVERAKLGLGERIYGSPAVVDGLVWLGVDRGSVVAIDPDNGNIVRRLRLASDKVDADTALLPALLPGKRMIVFAAGPTVYGARTDGTFLFRRDLGRKVYGSPALLADGGFAVGGQDDALTLLDADGNVRKRVPLGADVDGSPAVGDDGTVFAGTDGDEVVAVSPAGDIRWRSPVEGAVRGALAVARDGVVLASTYGPSPAIFGLDPATGGRVFRFGIQGTGAREHGIHGAPVETADGTLLFGGPDDLVHALTPDGRSIWTVEAGGDVDGTFALVDDGVLVACSSSGRVTRWNEAGEP
jgi:outer membrane protein assembly factor BamB